MFQNLTFNHPITEEIISWNIEIINLTYHEWQNKQYEEQSMAYPSTGDKIQYILDKLNPTLYKGVIYFGTKDFAYKKQLSEYFKVLYTINDYLLYNHYIDILIDRIKQNLKYEYWATMKEFTHKSTRSASTNKNSIGRIRVKNEWIKHETKDMFTGKTVYLYENLKTGETQESENPDLLLELNSAKKKKTSVVKIELTFV